MRNSTIVMISILSLLAGCSEPNSTRTNDRSTDSLTMGEGVSTSDGLSVTNGNVILEEGEIGLAFAFVTAPGRKKEFTYFVVFNHEFPEGGVNTTSGGNGSSANGSPSISAFGNDCKIEYMVTLNPKTKAIESESILIADTAFHPKAGKLFVVDMKNNPLGITQIGIESPSEIPDLEKPNAVETFGQEILDRVRKANQRVDEFCRRIEN